MFRKTKFSLLIKKDLKFGYNYIDDMLNVTIMDLKGFSTPVYPR